MGGRGRLYNEPTQGCIKRVEIQTGDESFQQLRHEVLRPGVAAIYSFLIFFNFFGPSILAYLSVALEAYRYRHQTSRDSQGGRGMFPFSLGKETTGTPCSNIFFPFPTAKGRDSCFFPLSQAHNFCFEVRAGCAPCTFETFRQLQMESLGFLH